MLGVELSGGDGCILHIVTEITAAYQDRVETQVDIGLFFTVSLLAKASITNCRFNLSAGVSLFRLTEKPNRRTVENTIFPFSKGRISKPADTWLASNSTAPLLSSRYRFSSTRRLNHSMSTFPIRTGTPKRSDNSVVAVFATFVAHRECATRWLELRRISRTG